MTNIATKLTPLLKRFNKLSLINTQVIRHSGYYSSEFSVDVKPNVKYEVSKNPEEWKYVERILPILVVPEPPKKEVYPSGWKPQADDLTNSPYFVARTRNHMIPVYLKLSQHNIRRHTVIRRIKGDIWTLEKEFREFLQKGIVKPLRSQVNEFAGIIIFNGDYVNAVKYWLEKRNF